MLYPTLNQPIVILTILAAGLLAGFIFDISKLLAKGCGKLKFADIFFDFLAVLFSFFLLLTVNLFVNYGQFRGYVFVLFLAAILLERALSNLIVRKISKNSSKKRKINKKCWKVIKLLIKYYQWTKKRKIKGKY